jgi:hypothetical protein
LFLSQGFIELKVGNDLEVGSLILLIYDARGTCAMMCVLPYNIFIFHIFLLLIFAVVAQ